MGCEMGEIFEREERRWEVKWGRFLRGRVGDVM
jgi:hypothetical protein